MADTLTIGARRVLAASAFAANLVLSTCFAQTPSRVAKLAGKTCHWSAGALVVRQDPTEVAARSRGIVACLIPLIIVQWDDHDIPDFAFLPRAEGAVVFAQTKGPAPKTDSSPTANTQNGKHVFETHGCPQCHGAQGQGLSNPQTQEAAPRIGPTRLSQAAFVGFVRHPLGKMPAYRSQDVSEAELADLYAFLQSLAPPVKADPSSANSQNGQRLFMSYGCYECHGNEGQGSTQTAASRIGPIQIPFAAFVAYIRQPSAQMPPYSDKAVSDAELAGIYAFLLSRPASPPAKSIPLLNQ
jgi:mono/diheme cytochrome c family protein